MTHELLQKRLMRFLWAYEALVIAACMAGGLYIALGQGGSWVMATPLLLVGCAEALRVPVAGLSTRLGIGGRLLAYVVMIAIAVISFEGLSMVFESFLDNRSGAVMQAQRIVDRAQEALNVKEKQIAETRSSIEVAKSNVAALDADIANKEQHPPVQPGFSGKTCGPKNSTCASDRQARADYSAAQKAHIATLADLRSQRKAAQEALDRVSARTVIHTDKETDALQQARQGLSDTLHLSPMHRLAASILGVRVADLTEDGFERIKRWGVIGLSASFATLSAAVSLVAHSPEHDGREGKATKAFRAYMARRRKAVIRVERVEVPTGERIVEVEKRVEVEKPVTIIRYLPAPYPAGQLEQRNGRRGMPSFRPAKPEAIPANILEVSGHDY